MERDVLIQKGWRRHAIFCPDNGSLQQLKPHLPDEVEAILALPDTIALVATYDCAVVSGDFEGEPWIHLLIATPCNLDKQFTRGRHERRMQFEVSVGDKAIGYETNAAQFLQVPRSVLLNCSPSDQHSLNDQDKRFLNVWAAERFRREAWPDEFNNRLRPSQKRLKKLWQRYNNFVSGFYVRLTPFEEIPEGDNYEVCVIVAVETGMQRALYKHIADIADRDRKEKISPKEAEAVLANEVLVAFGDSIKFEADRNNTWGKAVEIIEEESLTVGLMKEFFLFSPYHISLLNDPAPLEIQAGH